MFPIAAQSYKNKAYLKLTTSYHSFDMIPMDENKITIIHSKNSKE